MNHDIPNANYYEYRMSYKVYYGKREKLARLFVDTIVDAISRPVSINALSGGDSSCFHLVMPFMRAIHYRWRLNGGADR